MSDEIKVRRLCTKDLYMVGSMLKGAMPEIRKLDLKGGEDKKEEIGKELFMILVNACYDEAWDWLADVAGMTRDELMEASLDTPLEIVQQISKSEDVAGFFKRVSQLTESS